MSQPRLFWVLQTGGWTVFFIAMFIAGLQHWSAGFTAVHKLSLTMFGFLVTLAMRSIYRAANRHRVPQVLIFTVALPLCYGAAAVWMACHHLVLGWYTGRNGLFPDYTNAIYYSFLLIAWSVLYFGVQSWLELQRERERVLRTEAMAHEARLRALRLQLQPHFLFNTLNSISTLVSESRNEEANRMIARLGDFLRLTLAAPDCDQVPLSAEVEFVRKYLEIEQVRFGERLRVDLDIPSATREGLVPGMILQPLVENALRHAVMKREDGGAVLIRAVRKNRSLCLSVEDNGPGLGSEHRQGNGVGLTNTRERLSEMYGTHSEIRFSRSSMGGLAVSITLPFREAAS